MSGTKYSTLETACSALHEDCSKYDMISFKSIFVVNVRGRKMSIGCVVTNCNTETAMKYDTWHDQIHDPCLGEKTQSPCALCCHF